MFHIPIRYFLRFTCLLLSLLMVHAAYSQPTTITNSGFTLVGYIEDLKIQNTADSLSAGTMTVNGINVTLPANLLITMPGQYLTLYDIFQGKTPTATATISNSISGLALKDPVPYTPRLPIEATIIGNVSGTVAGVGNYVAGVVRLAQLGLHMGAGVIDSIDYTQGALFIRSSIGGTLTKVVLNDPNGVYGLKNSEKIFSGYRAGTHPMDERFASDSENAPFRAETGYPLCVPRLSATVDDECPTSNRINATGIIQSRFTCGTAQAEPLSPVLSNAPGAVACDPSKKAPLMVGDYITYSGMLTEESTNTFFIAAHGIAAMLGIYTSPGAPEAWITIEEVRIGTSGYQDISIPQEETPRVKIVGFTTDPSLPVSLAAIDIDPITGARTERIIMNSITPQTLGQIGRLRMELRPPKTAVFQVPRDIVIRRIDSFPQLPKGQRVFMAPVTEYIYPENTLFGRPKNPVSVPFEYFCFLKKGAGPLDTLGRSAGPVIGPLSPFPRGMLPTQVNPINPTLNIDAVCP
jgi:hypothetical protein